jgi:hypothetical protein
MVRSFETKKLCELTSAADALEMRPLVDTTSRGLARTIEGKSRCAYLFFLLGACSALAHL